MPATVVETTGFPAVIASAITVGATDKTDHEASFSNYGAASVHLAAPGVNITSTTRSNTYASYSGTSMATPHVAGAAALTLAACGLTTTQLKDLYAEVFGEAGRHARSAVGVAELPLGAPVEVEAIVQVS